MDDKNRFRNRPWDQLCDTLLELPMSSDVTRLLLSYIRKPREDWLCVQFDETWCSVTDLCFIPLRSPLEYMARCVTPKSSVPLNENMMQLCFFRRTLYSIWNVNKQGKWEIQVFALDLDTKDLNWKHVMSRPWPEDSNGRWASWAVSRQKEKLYLWMLEDGTEWLFRTEIWLSNSSWYHMIGYDSGLHPRGLFTTKLVGTTSSHLELRVEAAEGNSKIMIDISDPDHPRMQEPTESVIENFAHILPPIPYRRLFSETSLNKSLVITL